MRTMLLTAAVVVLSVTAAGCGGGDAPPLPVTERSDQQPTEPPAPDDHDGDGDEPAPISGALRPDYGELAPPIAAVDAALEGHSPVRALVTGRVDGDRYAYAEMYIDYELQEAAWREEHADGTLIDSVILDGVLYQRLPGEPWEQVGDAAFTAIAPFEPVLAAVDIIAPFNLPRRFGAGGLTYDTIAADPAGDNPDLFGAPEPTPDEDLAPDEAAPDEAAPDEAAPDEAAPDEAAPDEAGGAAGGLDEAGTGAVCAVTEANDEQIAGLHATIARAAFGENLDTTLQRQQIAGMFAFFEVCYGADDLPATAVVALTDADGLTGSVEVVFEQVAIQRIDVASLLNDAGGQDWDGEGPDWDDEGDLPT